MQLTTTRSIRLSADVADRLRSLPNGMRAEAMRTALRDMIARHSGRLPKITPLPRGSRGDVAQIILHLPEDLSKAVELAAKAYRLSALVEMALRASFGMSTPTKGDAK